MFWTRSICGGTWVPFNAQARPGVCRTSDDVLGRGNLGRPGAALLFTLAMDTAPTVEKATAYRGLSGGQSKDLRRAFAANAVVFKTAQTIGATVRYAL